MKFSITLADATGSIDVVFWNAMCRFHQLLEVGQGMKIAPTSFIIIITFYIYYFLNFH